MTRLAQQALSLFRSDAQRAASRQAVSQQPASQQPVRRSFAAWLALVLLVGVGQVVPALHFLFVAHHLCAEHGELVDVSAADVGSAGRASALAAHTPARENGALSREKVPSTGTSCIAGAASHAHEHCGVAALAHASGSAAASSARVALLPALEVARAPADARTAHVGIELRQYAPKLAPPASALAATSQLTRG